MERRLSIVNSIGHEGSSITSLNIGNLASIAVLTSGGDCQGMNAAIRAVVRMGIYLGSEVYMVKEGYIGLIKGENYITKSNWVDVSGIIQKGGTVLGSSRCKEFRTREGRYKAALNLVKRKIVNLIVIGGDGSLTGADTFRSEWESLIEELYKNDEINQEEYRLKMKFNIVGIVGSIDNDFYGTDMTIGADSALHRIIESIDHISTTAFSHQRCFILEVMGRNCGYLALLSALATAADWVFIPEKPPIAGWEDRLCKKLALEREMGQRLNIIIVAEGAIDENGHKISSNRLQHLVEDRLQYDTRITILGHVQRGGNPSAFDRILATRMGVEAVVAILDTTTNSEPSVISINGNKICRIPLKKSVELTSSIKDAYAKKDYECVMHLRGPNYVKNLNNYLMMSKLYMKCPSIHLDALHPKIYIVNVGAPACGINACVRSLTKLFILNKCIVYHVKNGLNGFIDNEIYTANWSNTNYWIHEGGSLLGTNRNTPKKIGIDVLAEKFKMRNINCLIIIGGYEAFLSVVQMEEARKDHSEFRIPIGIIPATISNNVPGTTLCIGSDTALNEITYTCDRLKQSATGTRKRVFIVETHGGFCGYLATMAGLSSGADAAYIFEKKIDVQDIKNDAEHLVQKMSEGTERGIILRCEKASKNYDIHFMRAIFEEIGQDSFDTRINVIGHIQQGGSPSAFDRALASKFATFTVNFVMNLFKEKEIASNCDINSYEDSESAFIIGIESCTKATPVKIVYQNADNVHRIPKNQWWMCTQNLLRILAKHELC